MTKHRSWDVLIANRRELGLSGIMSLHMCIGIAATGAGMLVLGALGASVGYGIQQTMMLLASQGVGSIGGEWRGVHGRPRSQMFLGIALLIIAAGIMAYANTLK
jgi:hypothetical protein